MADSAAGRAHRPEQWLAVRDNRSMNTWESQLRIVAGAWAEMTEDAKAWASMEEKEDVQKSKSQGKGSVLCPSPPAVFDQGTSVEPSSSSQSAAPSLPV